MDMQIGLSVGGEAADVDGWDAMPAIPRGDAAEAWARDRFGPVLRGWAWDVLRLRAAGMDRPSASLAAGVGRPPARAVAPPRRRAA
jgi:hypothetical protein